MCVRGIGCFVVVVVVVFVVVVVVFNFRTCIKVNSFGETDQFGSVSLTSKRECLKILKFFRNGSRYTSIRMIRCIDNQSAVSFFFFFFAF